MRRSEKNIGITKQTSVMTPGTLLKYFRYISGEESSSNEMIKILIHTFFILLEECEGAESNKLYCQPVFSKLSTASAFQNCFSTLSPRHFMIHGLFNGITDHLQFPFWYLLPYNRCIFTLKMSSCQTVRSKMYQMPDAEILKLLDSQASHFQER